MTRVRSTSASATDILFQRILTIHVNEQQRRWGNRGHPGKSCHLHIVDARDTSLELRRSAHAVFAVAPLLPPKTSAYAARFSSSEWATKVLLERGLHSARHDLRRGPNWTSVGDRGPDTPSQSDGGERDSHHCVAAYGAYRCLVLRHLVRRRSLAGELSRACGPDRYRRVYLPPDLTAVASPTKSGYTYTFQPGPNGLAAQPDCNGNPVALDYYVTAVPVDFGNTGSRAFASNEGHVIWQDPTGVAPVEPFATAGTVAPIQ